MELTIRERVRLVKVRREVARGERDEGEFSRRERDWLAWMQHRYATDQLSEWPLYLVTVWPPDTSRLRDPPMGCCTCGLSDGDGCHCDEVDARRIAH